LKKALVEKMTFMMTQLQQKAKTKAPSVNGTLADSIRDPRAEIDGDEVIGYLTWGGAPTTVSYKGGKAYDYARILNEGSKAIIAVNPLEETGSRTDASKTLSGKSERRFGKGVLAFMMGGKQVFAEYAFPKGTRPNRFVEDALMEMKGELIQGIQETISSVMKEE
jgi:hypothetical protein